MIGGFLGDGSPTPTGAQYTHLAPAESVELG